MWECDFFPFAQVAVAFLLQGFLHFFIDFVCLGRRQGEGLDCTPGV